MDTRTLNSKRNIIVGVLSNCLIPLFAMIIKSVIVQYFSVEYLGLTSVFSSIFQILNIAELGFSTSVIVNLYKPLKDGNTVAVRSILAYFKHVYRIIGLIILIAGMIACLVLERLVGETNGIHVNIYIIYLLYLAEKTTGFMLFSYKEALFNAAQRLDIIKIVYITIYFIRSVLQIVALIVFRSLYLYVAMLLLGTILYNILLNILSKKKYAQYYPEGKIDKETKCSILKQVSGVSVSNILGVCRDSLNPIIITAFLGLYMAGQYSNYCVIYDAVIGFFLVITKAIQGSIGNSTVSESVEKNYVVFTKMEFLHNILIIVCTAYLASLYQPFMKIWMGEELMFTDPIMLLFVLYFYIRSMGEVRNAFFSALGYWWKAKKIFMAEAVTNTILLICLGKIWGVAGIIISPSISLLCVNYIGVTNLLFREYFGTGRKEFYFNRILYTVITVIISSISYYFCGLIPYEGIAGLIVRMVICTFILVIAVPSMLFIVKRKYMKESITFIKQIIKA